MGRVGEIVLALDLGSAWLAATDVADTGVQ